MVITLRERVVFPLEERLVLRGYEEYTDLPEDARVQAYSLGEIAAEKVVALTDRARNEPRDLYDLWSLVSGGLVDLADVVGAVEEKWAFRGKRLADVRKELAAKELRYRRLWDVRLSGQLVVLPPFDEVFRTVRRALRRAGIFWCLGSFDRAWGPERPIFGTVLFMSSANTARKVRVRGYLERYGSAAS